MRPGIQNAGLGAIQIRLLPLRHHLPRVRRGDDFSPALCGRVQNSASRRVCRDHDFSFAPLKEVGWLFLGIFITMVPVLDYMQLHARDLAIETPAEFYWVTGGLSAVLDNAPTYLAFLANALGRGGLSLEDSDALQKFVSSSRAELAAISMGAVLFGAMTYIGNSPNFMIKSITEQHKMPTPGFIAFIAKFSLPILLPVLLLVCWLLPRS